MAGRFFTAPFLVCVVWLVARGLPRTPEREVMGLLLATLALGLLFPAGFRINEKFECTIGANGIVSERLCYADYTGLSENVGSNKYESHGRYRRGLELRRHPGRVLVSTNVGIMSYAAGPKVHIIDAMALTDPLLARIPFASQGGFRVGHFQRDAPKGYELSLRTGQNSILDPCIHAYYDVLARVINGPLFSRQRWSAIFGLNFGRYDYLMKQPCVLAAPAQVSN